MKQVLRRLLVAILIGAAIGAAAGLVIGGFDVLSLLGGAFIGGAIGSFFGLRTQIIRRTAAEANIGLPVDPRDGSG